LTEQSTIFIEHKALCSSYFQWKSK